MKSGHSVRDSHPGRDVLLVVVMAFAIGVGVYFLMLRLNATPDDILPETGTAAGASSRPTRWYSSGKHGPMTWREFSGLCGALAGLTLPFVLFPLLRRLAHAFGKK